MEDLADGGGHGETAIAVDVDLADGALRGFAELVFADADGVFQFAAVLVDDLHEILRDGAGAVEDDREAGDALFDFVEDVQTDLRIVAGLELVGAVGRADGDGQGVDASALHEFFDFFGLRVDVLRGFDVVFLAGEDAEFAFDRHIVLVGVFDDLRGLGAVFVKRQLGTVDHDGGEAVVDAALAGCEIRAVVQMQADRDQLAVFLDFFRVFRRALGHVAQQRLVGVFTSALGNLQDQGGLGLDAGLDDGLELFHVVEVVSGNGITAFHGFREHCAGVHKTQIFVINHLFLLLVDFFYGRIDRLLKKAFNTIM